jgi:sodium transport system permease protein
VRLSAVSAILITAATFGLAHSLSPVQIINAALMGVVLGLIALKTNHISPCIAFHLSYNGLNLLRVAYSEKLRVLPYGEPLWSWVFTPGGETGVGFTPMMVIAASVASLGLLALIWQLGRLESSGASRSSSPDADGMPYVSQPPREESGA